jgi:hypothetical protein
MSVESEHVHDEGSPAAVVAILLALLGIGLCVFLFFRLHALTQTNQNQVATFQAQQATMNSQLTAALSHLNQADTSVQEANQLGGQTVLASLQILLLQGQPKTVLQSDVAALVDVVVRLNQVEATSLTAHLKAQIDALPNLNPADALSKLDQISQSFANLSFVPAVGVQSKMVIPANVQGFWSRLWYGMSSLIVVRTDNQIGTTLVTETARFDALRTLNFQIQQIEWQILHNQDPTVALNQLKATLTEFTAADAHQTACLSQIDALLASGDFYAAADVNAILANIAALQAVI